MTLRTRNEGSWVMASEFDGMSDANLIQLADDNAVPHDMEQLRPDGTLDPAARERLIIALRRNKVSLTSNVMYALNQQVQEYEELFPEDTAPRDLYLARVPPQQGVRGPTGQSYDFTLGASGGRSGPSSIGEDTSWYTVYTTPGGIAFLQERGYEVRAVDEVQEDTGVVIAMPRHRTRPDKTVGVEAPYGRHHTADVLNISEGIRQYPAEQERPQMSLVEADETGMIRGRPIQKLSIIGERDEKRVESIRAQHDGDYKGERPLYRVTLPTGEKLLVRARETTINEIWKEFNKNLSVERVDPSQVRNALDNADDSPVSVWISRLRKK